MEGDLSRIIAEVKSLNKYVRQNIKYLSVAANCTKICWFLDTAISSSETNPPPRARADFVTAPESSS